MKELDFQKRLEGINIDSFYFSKYSPVYNKNTDRFYLIPHEKIHDLEKEHNKIYSKLPLDLTLPCYAIDENDNSVSGQKEDIEIGKLRFIWLRYG